jgi:pentatricopeptide repeat protein
MEEQAIELFFKIKKPDKIILSIFFNACAQLKTENALNLAKKVFDQFVIKSNPSNDLLYSVLNMFIKCDDLQSAETLFGRIHRDIISYGSMMKFYNIKDQPEKTLELYQKMKEENLSPNEIIFVLLIDASSKLGDLSLSQPLINEIPHNFLLDPWIQTGLIDLWVKILLTSID